MNSLSVFNLLSAKELTKDLAIKLLGDGCEKIVDAVITKKISAAEASRAFEKSLLDKDYEKLQARLISEEEYGDALVLLVTVLESYIERIPNFKRESFYPSFSPESEVDFLTTCKLVYSLFPKRITENAYKNFAERIGYFNPSVLESVPANDGEDFFDEGTEIPSEQTIGSNSK